MERLPVKYPLKSNIASKNPFHLRLGKFEDPYEEFVDICTDNLTWAVNQLLKKNGRPIKLAPFQSVMLDILWNKTFPIILCSRGASKCVSKNSIVQTSSGFFDIEQLCKDECGANPSTISMFGENGFNDTSFTWTNMPEKTFSISTSFGYKLSGIKNHKIRIIENGEIVWKEINRIKSGDYVCICRDDRYEFSGKFTDIPNEMGYLLGALIGDGSFVKSHSTSIGFTNADRDIVDRVKHACRLVKNVSFSSYKNKIEFALNFGKRERKLSFLKKYGLHECYSKDKVIPNSILQSNKTVMANFMSGYFDTDGCVNNRGEVQITSASLRLIEQIHVILLSFGIISIFKHMKVKYKDGRKDAYRLSIQGENALLFSERIGFKCSRKQEKLQNILSERNFNPNRDLIRNSKNLFTQLNRELKTNGFKIGRDGEICDWKIKNYDYSYKKLWDILCKYIDAKHLDSYKKLKILYDKNFFFDKVTYTEILPPEKTFDVHIPEDHTYISNGFISHNTWTLAVYAILRAIFTPGSKIVIVAASFRQSRLVFNYIKEIYDDSPLLRAAVTKLHQPADSREMAFANGSVIMALPLGNGEKIRGVRATHILSDEFAAIPEEIFQVVVRGFAAVASDPVRAAERIYTEEELISSGKMSEKDRSKSMSNQIVYSGTANYQFNHFYKLYNIHKKIIESKFEGNADEINDQYELEEETTYFEGFIDYKDYAIVQIPYNGLPKGFMDEKQIAQARATMPNNLFQMEYCCTFPTDSDGFFRRSMINGATPGLRTYDKGFSIETIGDPSHEYVMGIDPARKTDNFAISVLKLMSDKTYRNVFCYSMNKKSWPQAVRKVREIMRNFNIVRMAVDAGGGGTTVEDLLQDSQMLGMGEMPVWRYDDEEQKRFHGLHILDMVNFTPSWIAEANYGLASDIEHCRIQFPNRIMGSSDGSLEDGGDIVEVWSEIDEQINEMCQIVVTVTKTGVQHFDLPETPTTNKTLSSYERKDRYSALLLSSYAARTYLNEGGQNVEPFTGRWV